MRLMAALLSLKEGKHSSFYSVIVVNWSGLIFTSCTVANGQNALIAITGSVIRYRHVLQIQKEEASPKEAKAIRRS
jgi:hypothetical protein